MLVLAASTRVVVLTVVLGLVLPVAWLAAARVWRGEAQTSPRARFSEQWQVRSFRVFPLTVVAFTLAFLALLVDVIWGHHAGAAEVAYRITSIGFLVLCVVAIVVRLTARPQWLIPPSLRDSPRR